MSATSKGGRLIASVLLSGTKRDLLQRVDGGMEVTS